MDLASLSSVDLLKRAQAGDREALELLFGRYLPELRRWASGRLPRWARDIADTTDLVQDTLLQAYKGIERIDPERAATVRAYLRQAILNRVRDELRRRRRQPLRSDLGDEADEETPSPFDQAVGEELFDAYETALERLNESERELIVSRVQMALSYQEIAELTGRPSANAARSAIVRALARLSEEMDRHGSPSAR